MDSFECTFGEVYKWLCGLYYKNTTIINDTSRVVRMTPQHGASLTIVILVTIEVSFMLLELAITLLNNIYYKGVIHDDHHIFIVQVTNKTK